MRIAVTGTHGAGKSTLIEDFCDAEPSYVAVAEPYWELVQQGVAFADGAGIDALEEQLAASCALILGTNGTNVVFDRCPLDFIAYLEVVSARERYEWTPDGRMLTRIEKALASFDIVAFVPLTTPDTISIPIELPKLRAQVDRRLKLMLREDSSGLLADGPRVIEVSGSRAERVGALRRAIAGR